jgi:uncharacterized protein YcfL
MKTKLGLLLLILLLSVGCSSDPEPVSVSKHETTALDRTVSWNGSTDVSSLAGKTVRLRIAIQDGDLYALKFS